MLGRLQKIPNAVTSPPDPGQGHLGHSLNHHLEPLPLFFHSFCEEDCGIYCCDGSRIRESYQHSKIFMAKLTKGAIKLEK